MGGTKTRHNSTGGTLETTHLSTPVPYYPPRLGQDLISLVEKGRVGMSSNSSCCSSTTSSIGDKHGIPATKPSPHLNEAIILAYVLDQKLLVGLMSCKSETQKNFRLKVLFF